MPDYYVLKIAVPSPVYGLFDYLLPTELAHHPVLPGMRVLVPFGRQRLTGIIIEQTNQSALPSGKLKAVLSLPDKTAIFPAHMMQLLQWAANYYLYPPGEVMQAALPVYLRQLKHAFSAPEGEPVWSANPADKATLQQLQKRAPKQYQLYQLLARHTQGISRQTLNQQTSNWRQAMQALLEKHLVNKTRHTFCWQAPVLAQTPTTLKLNPQQQKVVSAINDRHEMDNRNIHCLFGITGSGKTEVYLALSQHMLAQKRQILILVPEISLTPQLTRRFAEHLQTPIAVLHSGLNDNQRYTAWYAASTGKAHVVIGTRSSIFTPMPELGMIIVDEEHDGSYKQQDGFRYNARDLSIVRARQQHCPVILGSATPSLETLHNINEQRYQGHYLRQRPNQRPLPSIQLINLCNQPLHEGLSDALLASIKQHIKQQGQVLLFINRRGFAPLLLCHHCGWTTQCPRCDANMTYHKKHQRLLCHHCGIQRPVPVKCTNCGSSEIIAMGSGTERIENVLQTSFPQLQVSRIDRDTTRNKGKLAEKLQQAHSGESAILVGTQMLAKGHDFPGVTLVAIVDSDQALYSTDFRAAEHLAQLITQVSGRAGRADKPGEVLIQTHHPEHPLLQTLLHQGYEKFATSALAERKATGLPPCTHLILIRSDAIYRDDARQFLSDAVVQFKTGNNIQLDIFGPLPAPMERRAGRYRYQLMLQARERKPLHQLLSYRLPLLRKIKSARKVRWSIDVDPYDTF